MRKLLFVLLIITSSIADGQVFYRRSEFGASVGGANYFGDLNTNYGFQYFRYSAGVFYKYNFTEYIALRIGGNYAHVGYSDRYSTNVYHKQRNLDFKSNILEFGVMADFNFFRYTIGDYDHRFTPYVTLGASMFYYNPYTNLDGKNYFLRPQGTEGQNLPEYEDRKYKDYAFAFPIGAGIKVWLSKGLTMSFEIVNRYTSTDYLDDVSTTYVGKDKFVDQIPSPYPSPAFQLQDRSPEVSDTELGIKGRQRGVSTTKDHFMLFQLGLSFRLPTYRCPDNLR
jgi:hypothetical protein